MSAGDPIARALWSAAGLLAAAVLVALALRLWPLLHPTISARAMLDPGCDLRQRPCSARFADGGLVTLAIAPRGIPSVTPLTVTVDLAGLPAPLRVELDLAGADMNMGYNRGPLAPSAAAGHYTGKAMLPVCVRAWMLWEAQVLLYYPNRLLAAPFRFSSERL